MTRWSPRWADVTCPWPRAATAAPEQADPRVRVGMPEVDLLARRLEALGLRGVPRLRVTDNRTVMVSLSKHNVLSIHRGFAQAPDRVLKAVVRFVSAGTPKALRRAAQHEILSFRAESHAPGPPKRRRAADRPRPGDIEKAERLARLFGEHNAQHFGGRLPELPIRLSGRMRSRLGQLCLRHDTGKPYEITISRRHVERHGWAETAHTLLHEMVHLWQHVSDHRVDHGPRFRAKAQEIGVVSSAHRAIRTPAGRTRAARLH